MTHEAALRDPRHPGPKPASLAALGALLGDPVRSAFVLHLSDGSRRSAGELASLAGISPQAASAHLGQLVHGGLLSVEKQGRHRYFRISSGEAAEMIEGLANWIDDAGPAARHRQFRCARLCYDHLAGQLGVAVHDRMVALGLICFEPGGPDLSPAGRAWCCTHGVALTPAPGSRRPLIRLCQDWSEQRAHLGGRLGAGLARMFLEAGHVRRGPQLRTLQVSLKGARFLRTELGLAMQA